MRSDCYRKYIQTKSLVICVVLIFGFLALCLVTRVYSPSHESLCRTAGALAASSRTSFRIHPPPSFASLSPCKWWRAPSLILSFRLWAYLGNRILAVGVKVLLFVIVDPQGLLQLFELLDVILALLDEKLEVVLLFLLSHAMGNRSVISREDINQVWGMKIPRLTSNSQGANDSNVNQITM